MLTLSPALSSNSSAAVPRSLWRRIVLVLSASLVVALAAQVSFPLPFTPVPFSLQPLAVLGAGLWLGPWEGALALLAYLGEGALGLPVFSLGQGGAAVLAGSDGGFLLAYPVVAFLAGFLTHWLARRMSNFLAAVLACTVAVLVLFISGASWLAFEAHLGLHTVWILAVAPFLPGEAIKVLAAAGTFRALTART